MDGNQPSTIGNISCLEEKKPSPKKQNKVLFNLAKKNAQKLQQ